MRRQFILTKDKWHVRTVRSRRRELMLRDLCHSYYAEGQRAALEAAAKDQINSDSVNYDNVSPDAAPVSYDESVGIMEQQSYTERSNDSIGKSIPASVAQLHIGSNAKIWLDFGTDQSNFVGESQCLPVIMFAPGNPVDTDTPIYFHVVIKTKDISDLCFSLDNVGLDKDNVTNGTEFTIREGEFQTVYATWSPSNTGGLRESIFVQTTFHMTHEIIAGDEIVAVGCAGCERDVISRENGLVDQVRDEGSLHHNDLAQSPFDGQGNDTAEFDNVHVHDLSQIDEVSQDEFDRDCDEKEDYDSRANETLETESQSSSHVESESAENESMVGNKDEKPEKIAHSAKGANQHQLHSTIQGKLAKIRDQRPTISSAPRDSRGRRIRTTHPSATTNRPGLSNRAKLLRYNRYTRPQSKQISISNNHLKQTQGSSLEENSNVGIIQDSENINDDFEGSQESTNVETIAELLIDKGEIQHAEVCTASCMGKIGLESKAANVSAESEEGTMPLHADEFESAHSDSSSCSDLLDDSERQFDSPATRTMLQTMGNVSVELEEAELSEFRKSTGTPFREDSKEREEETNPSLEDEISGLRDYLTPRSQVHTPKAVPDVGTTAATVHQAATDDKKWSPDAATISSHKSKVFTFEDTTPHPQDGLHDQDKQSEYKAMTSPERSKSYKNATNELNEMMKNKSNTPLKDLHDQINHIINAKTTLSSSMNTDLTPEPDQVVGSRINGTSLQTAASNPSRTTLSTKSQTPSDAIRNALLDNSNQSRMNSARKSAQALYFYRSPRNADANLSGNGKPAVSLDVARTTKPEKIISEPHIDKANGNPNLAKKNPTAAATDKPTTLSKKNATTASKESCINPDSDYKSRIQTIRSSRSNASLSTASVNSSPSSLPNGKNNHRPKTAKSTARALYFFQSPPPPPTSNDTQAQSSHRVSALLHKTGLPSTKTPSPSSRSKSFAVSPPAPKLSTREQMAIDKHIHSMKKKVYEC